MNRLSFVATSALFVFADLALSACSDPSPTSAPIVTPPAEADSPCAAGFALDARGFCVEIVATSACPAGTRPRIGQTTCEPVGVTSACPVGTVAAESGWGCDDIRGPATACVGATREALGATACVPVGDCDGAFPPAGALVVDDDFEAAELDGMHFRTIGEALAAASPGATIAVAAGTYAESVIMKGEVSLVGRCPSLVTVTTPGGVEPGITVERAKVNIRGLTLTGHLGGIALFKGADATIEDVVVDRAMNAGVLVDASRATLRRSKLSDVRVDGDKRGGWGLAAGGGSDVTAEDVTIDGGPTGVFGASKGTTISLRRSLVTHQTPDVANAKRSSGVLSVSEALVVVEGSVIRDLAGDGAVTTESGGRAEVRDSVLRDVRLSGSLARGYGVLAFLEGSASVQSSTIADVASVAVLARDKGASVALTNAVVRGPAQSSVVSAPSLSIPTPGAGLGIQVIGGAKGSLDGIAVVGAWATAIDVASGAEVSIARSVVDGTRPVKIKGRREGSVGIALLANAATVTVDDVAITRAVLSGVSAGAGGIVGGSGLYVRDVAAGAPLETGAGMSVGDGGRLELSSSAVAEGTAAGVYGVGTGAVLHLTDSTVHGTRTVGGGFGHGIVVGLGATALLENASVYDHPSIGLFVDEGRLRLLGSAVAANAVGIHVQNGSFLVESASEETLEDDEVRISPDTRFLGNQTKVGSGEVPLPSEVLDGLPE